MANSKNSGTNFEYATVDTLPGASGYFTNSLCPRDKYKTSKVTRIFFSIRETDADVSAAPSALSDVTVVLQYRCLGDAGWTDYVPLDASEFVIGNRVILEDIGNGVDWRAGVTSDGYTSGSVTFGFDW